MADFEHQQQVLAQHFATIMAEREPDVKILWENGPPPPTPLDGRVQEWAMFRFLPVEDRAAAIGTSLYRGLAIVEVRVHTPLGKGTGPSKRIEKSVQGAMREPIEGVFVGPAIFGASGESEGWYQTLIQFRVTLDEAVA